MKLNGNQIRETLAQAGYQLVARRERDALLRNEVGGLELFVANDDYAGYVVEIDAIGHEFVRTATHADVSDFFIV